MSPKVQINRRDRDAGQAMVEFALVVVFIFLLFVSILQIILLMHAYNTLADAAKEGVRYAIVHGTGAGAAGCSGPGTAPNVNPAVTCTDSTGANVVSDVANFAGMSFQNIVSTNFQCTTPSGDSINVCYDPNGANTNNPAFGKKCSQAGCIVSVTVSHQYNPLFGFSWPSFTLNAAASGTIAN